MTFEDFITSPGRRIHRPDNIITLDIFDMANILTAALQEKGFLRSWESLTPYDLEEAMNQPGYYLTIERKNRKLSVKRG